MSKFKVGDKVKIVRPMSMCERYRNTIHTITNVDDTYVYLDIVDDDPYCVKYVDYELELVEEPDLTGLHPMTPDEMQRVLEKFGYIDETMDTSNRLVVDSSDSSDDSIDAFRYFVESGLKPLYIHGIKEEKDMNKVVDLWYNRKRDKIINEYKEKEVEFYNNRYSVVESFNALVEQFNEDLESLYKMDKATEQFVLTENAPNNVIKYCLDLDKLKEEFEVEYLIKRNEELKEIEDIREEVEAQLSLSDDLKYQQEVLERYGIISKKTKKIVG